MRKWEIIPSCWCVILLVLFLLDFHKIFEVRQYGKVSFQEFRNEFLESGLGHRIVISKKNVARGYVNNFYSNQTKDNVGKYQCSFDSGTVDSFEFKL